VADNGLYVSYSRTVDQSRSLVTYPRRLYLRSVGAEAPGGPASGSRLPEAWAVYTSWTTRRGRRRSQRLPRPQRAQVSNAGGTRVSVIGLGAVWLLCAGFAGTPEVLPDRVIFVGGKVVTYEAAKTLQPDPRAIRQDQPVSVTERPVILRSLKRVVIVRTEQLFEGRSMRLAIYDFTGTLLGSSEEVAVNGDGLFFLERMRRMFLGQSSSHVTVEESLLLDENGRLVRRVPQPRDVARFGHSRDERLVWVVSNIWIRPPGKEIAEQVGELRVIDTDGNLVARQEFDHAEIVRVRYRGRTYEIPVTVPHLP
jgi:hypothetical protein